MNILKNKHNLFRQLFFTLGVGYLLIAILMTLLILFYQHNKFAEDQKIMTQIFSDSIALQLSGLIWTENEVGLNKLIEGTSKLPFIKNLSVIGNGDRRLGAFQSQVKYSSYVVQFEKEEVKKTIIKKNGENIGTLIIKTTNLSLLRPLVESLFILIFQIIMIGLVLVTVGTYLINKFIILPVIEIKTRLEDLDMEQIELIEFNYPYDNEIQNLQKGINELLSGLIVSKERTDEVLNEMEHTSEKLTLSQEEIEESFSARTKELKNLLEYTDHAKNEAAVGKSLVKNGKAVILQMDDAMKKIETSNIELSKIAVVFHEIQKRTSKINKIVQESRLLSFNAEIEAAHAGVFGLGFAVVAEEMGNLATVSGSIASEINDTINRSTNDVQDTLKETNRTVEVGKENSQECLSAFSDLEVSLNKIFQLIESIEGDDTF